MSYNPGLLFYKHYYKGIQFNAGKPAEKSNEEKFIQKNAILLNSGFQAMPDTGEIPGRLTFPLTTTYPGLIIGTGYTHGSGLMGEFKTGFYFDHTTGMPAIPGSTVKGLLRSAFPGMYYEKAEQLKLKQSEAAAGWIKLGDNRKKFMDALLVVLGYFGKPGLTVEKLEREIFDGMHGTNRESEKDHFPMRYRDIFMDAVITGSADGKIFSDEYITPHKNPLKNPIPIQILKVRPGVTFSFQFRLEVSTHQNRLLTPPERLELFRQILLFMGAGAKTNTGFGHFEDAGRVNLSEKKQVTAAVAETEVAVSSAAVVKPAPARTDVSRIKQGHFVEGTVVRKENGVLYILLDVEGYVKEVTCKFPADRIQAGNKVRLRVNNVQGRGDNFTIGVAEPLLIS